MNGICVSVIIPVYNVEKYLSDCVKSVCGQTYSNLQIILVDDGSTDQSGKMCDEFAKLDSRILVIHKENGGLSDARNSGLLRANGEFVFYLDSDDYLEENAIEFLVKIQQEQNAQIVVGNYYYTYERYEKCATSLGKGNIVLGKQKVMVALVTGKIQNFAWGKLIKSDIAKKYEFPKGKLFEDNYWAHLVFDEAETIVVSGNPMVHYRQRNDSISYTFDMKRLDILEGWLIRKEFLEEKYPELVETFLQYVAGNYINIAWLILTRMKKNRKKAFQKLRECNSVLRLQNYAEGKTKKLICKLEQNNILYAIAAIGERLKRGL